MRAALRMASEGSIVMALAFSTAAAYCMLRSIGSRRGTAAVETTKSTHERSSTDVQRPAFLSRSNLL
jgi:hypothetical protein